jgi:hypothetical protein
VRDSFSITSLTLSGWIGYQQERDEQIPLFHFPLFTSFLWRDMITVGNALKLTHPNAQELNHNEFAEGQVFFIA